MKFLILLAGLTRRPVFAHRWRHSVMMALYAGAALTILDGLWR